MDVPLLVLLKEEYHILVDIHQWFEDIVDGDFWYKG